MSFQAVGSEEVLVEIDLSCAVVVENDGYWMIGLSRSVDRRQRVGIVWGVKQSVEG